jgi:hypothetical protein
MGALIAGVIILIVLNIAIGNIILTLIPNVFVQGLFFAALLAGDIKAILTLAGSAIE